MTRGQNNQNRQAGASNCVQQADSLWSGAGGRVHGALDQTISDPVVLLQAQCTPCCRYDDLPTSAVMYNTTRGILGQILDFS